MTDIILLIILCVIFPPMIGILAFGAFVLGVIWVYASIRDFFLSEAAAKERMKVKASS